MSNFKEADIKLISMDFDDTLRQSFQTISSLMIELAEFLSIPVDDQVIRRLWGQKPEIITRHAFSELEQSGIDTWKLWKYFAQKKPERFVMPVFDGVIDSLSNLLSRGYYLGVLSNGSTSSIYDCIDSNFSELFNNGVHPFLFLHTKDNCIKPKPSPKAFDLAFKKIEESGLEITQENIVHIGDHFNDYYAAQARGVFPALVTTGVITREEFITAGVDPGIIFESFKELTELLLQL